jgi:hypothetical protein
VARCVLGCVLGCAQVWEPGGGEALQNRIASAIQQLAATRTTCVCFTRPGAHARVSWLSLRCAAAAALTRVCRQHLPFHRQ